MWPNCSRKQLEIVEENSLFRIRELLRKVNYPGRGTAIYRIVGPDLPRRLSRLQVAMINLDLSAMMFPQCDSVVVESRKDQTGKRWLSIEIFVTRKAKERWHIA